MEVNKFLIIALFSILLLPILLQAEESEELTKPIAESICKTAKGEEKELCADMSSGMLVILGLTATGTFAKYIKLKIILNKAKKVEEQLNFENQKIKDAKNNAQKKISSSITLTAEKKEALIKLLEEEYLKNNQNLLERRNAIQEIILATERDIANLT